MKLIKNSLIILVVLWSCFSNVIYATKPLNSHSWAVADFEMKNSTAGEDWAIGAADYLEVLLEENGLDILERRNINLILNERDLSNQGIISPKMILNNRRLKHVKFLINGTITQIDAKQFKLQITIIQADSAIEQQTINLTGNYPGDWDPILHRAAVQIAQTAPSTTLSHLKSKMKLVRDPFAAYLFNKGIDYYAKGELENALEAFYRAYNIDSTFLLALYWETKIFSELGMPLLAKVNQQTMEKQLKKYPQLNFLSKFNNSDNSAKLWTLVDAGGMPESAIKVLKNNLKQYGNISFLSPQHIQGVAREHDLELSGEFKFLEQKPWLLSEVFLNIEHISQKKQFAIYLQSYITGQLIGMVKIADNQPDLGNKLAQKILLVLKKQQNLKLKYKKREIKIGNSDSQFVKHLKAMQQKPKDLDKWFIWGRDLSFYKRKNHKMAVCDYIIDQIKPHPHYYKNGAKWLNSVIMLQRLTKGYGEFDRISHRSLADDFSLVAQLYPESSVSILLDYKLAQDYSRHNRHDKAVKCLRNMVKKLQQLKTINPDPGLYLNIYYFQAQELYLTGKIAEAKVSLAKAQQVIEKYSLKYIPAISAVNFIYFVNTGWELRYDSLIKLKNQASQTEDIINKVADLEHKLNSGATKILLSSSELYAKTLKEHNITQSTKFSLQSLKIYLQEHNSNLKLPKYVLAQCSYLALCPKSVEQQEDYKMIMSKLMTKTKNNRDLYYLHLLSGNIKLAEQFLLKTCPVAKANSSWFTFLEMGTDFYFALGKDKAGLLFLKHSIKKLLTQRQSFSNSRLPRFVRMLIFSGGSEVVTDFFKPIYMQDNISLRHKIEAAYWLGTVALQKKQYFKATEYFREIQQLYNQANVSLNSAKFGPYGRLTVKYLKYIRTFSLYAKSIIPPPPQINFVQTKATGIKAIALMAMTGKIYMKSIAMLRQSALKSLPLFHRIISLPGFYYKPHIQYGTILYLWSLRTKEPEVLFYLSPLLFDPRSFHSYWIIRLHKKYGAKANIAVPLYILLTEHWDPKVAKEAAAAIKIAPADDPQTIKRLKLLTKHPNKAIQNKAQVILNRLVTKK